MLSTLIDSFLSDILTTNPNPFSHACTTISYDDVSQDQISILQEVVLKGWGYTVSGAMCHKSPNKAYSSNYKIEDVYKQYHEKNHGCQIAISQGLTWAFTHIEEAIILEDDCLPHPSFFSFATHLLQHYRHDMRIGTISGANFQFGKKRTKHSYYFSSYFHCWGWATWKRAWNYFDFEMKSWPEILNRHFIDDILLQPEPIRLWERLLQDSYDNKTNSWAQRFMYSLWTQNLLSIMPQVNLVSNIGFDERAVHTKKPNRLSNMTTEVMEFPIKHPPYIIRDTKSDYRSYENAYLG